MNGVRSNTIAKIRGARITDRGRIASMATLHLTQAKHGTPWTLDLGEASVRVTGPPTLPQYEIPRAEAETRIGLPSLLENRRTIGIALGGGKFVELSPNKQAVAALKTYFDGAIAAAGPEAIRSLRSRGWRTTLVGAAILAAGVVLTATAREGPGVDAKGDGMSTFYHGAIAVGLVVVLRGVWTLARAARVGRSLEDSPTG
jgi:hypothetical protein